jgi:hypothetical protein
MDITRGEILAAAVIVTVGLTAGSFLYQMFAEQDWWAAAGRSLLYGTGCWALALTLIYRSKQ